MKTWKEKLETWKPIKRIGISRNEIDKVNGYDDLYWVPHNLSDEASPEWIDIFKKNWIGCMMDLTGTPKKFLVGNQLTIACPADSSKREFYEKQIDEVLLPKTNNEYEEYLHKMAKEEEYQKKRKSEEEKKKDEVFGKR